jgi:hypothetical protein
VTAGSPETITLTVAANKLPPGDYHATVRVGDFVVTMAELDVTLTVAPSMLHAVNGTGDEFALFPIIPVVFTDAATGTDIYPVGTGESYLFSIFDSGADIVVIGGADAAFLNIGAPLASNVRQDTRIRLNGLAAINPTTLTAPIGPHGTVGGAQAEVLNVRVGPRPAFDITLIGSPVVNAVVARIDNSTTVRRGPYAFCGGCFAEGPDITFWNPGDAGIPAPALQLPLERFGSMPDIDNAVNGQRYVIRDVLLRYQAKAVMDGDHTGAPVRFLFDTGTAHSIINVRLATALGLNLAAGGTFDCYTGAGKEGNEGYVISSISFVGATATGSGTYTVDNASVCVDVRSEVLNARWNSGAIVDGLIGENLFMKVPYLLHGPNDRVGILVP